jgi:hypothetical protein
MWRNWINSYSRRTKYLRIRLEKACRIAVPHSALVVKVHTVPRMVAGFLREVDENCALPGHYAATYRHFGAAYPSHFQCSRNPRRIPWIS